MQIARGVEECGTWLPFAGIGFAQLGCGVVCETKNGFGEVLVELFGVGQNGEVVAFLNAGRAQMEMARAYEDSARDFAVHRWIESDFALAEGKRGCVAVQLEIGN